LNEVLIMIVDLRERILSSFGVLGPIGQEVQKWLGQIETAAGPRATAVKVFLNGTWLGHPLHPVLTDVTLGAWSSAAVLDLADRGRGGELGRGADVLVAVGCAGGAAAAASGLADWQDQAGTELDVGIGHAIINTSALLLFSTSLALRLKGSRGPAIGLSLLGLGAAGIGGYLGGHLVFRLGTAVNRNAFTSGPKAWRAVADETDVVEGARIRKQVGNNQVLISRLGGEFCAVSAVCSHAGGPLDELPIENAQLHCPWHGSRFDLRTGRVIHGPATAALPVFDVRTKDGKVEIRRPPV
jgi:nitrite reductase/ring-hydroxylating ferredoxin subunit